MINIVHVDVNYNDRRMFTSIEVKTKFFAEKGGAHLDNQQLTATVSAAFHKTTLLTDQGKQLKTILDPKRSDIVDLVIVFKNNHLTFEDVARFIDAFQQALDETLLF